MPAKLIVPFTLLISLSTMASKKEEGKITGVKATKVQIAKLYDIFNIVGQCQNDNSRDYYANATRVVASRRNSKKGDILWL